MTNPNLERGVESAEAQPDSSLGVAPRSALRSGDWFGCGREITQESWDGFLAARQAYYEKKDFETWRDEQIQTLRWEFRHRPAGAPYQSFPDFCREQWQKGQP